MYYSMFFRITILFLSLLISAQRLEATNEVIADRSENVEIVLSELIQAESAKVVRRHRVFKNNNKAHTKTSGKDHVEFESIVKPDLVIRLRRIQI